LADATGRVAEPQ